MMYQSPAMTCTMLASIIVERVWSKLGKSSTRPLTHDTKPRPITPPQNQIFSPALKRPEGTTSLVSTPPPLTSQVMS